MKDNFLNRSASISTVGALFRNILANLSFGCCDKTYLSIVVIIICNFCAICSSQSIRIDIAITIDYCCFTFNDLIYCR